MIDGDDCIEVYGFGSFFREGCTYRDIDMLLIHDNLGLSSCRSVSYCKNQIILMHPNAHITLLSKQEEKSLSFIAKSKSTLIGCIYRVSLRQDIEKIGKEVNSLMLKKLIGPRHHYS